MLSFHREFRGMNDAETIAGYQCRGLQSPRSEAKLQSKSGYLSRFAFAPPRVTMNSRRRDSDFDSVLFSTEQKVVYAHDLCGNFTFLNHAGERILGYSCEEARRMNVADVMRADVASRILEQVTSNVGTAIGVVYEIEITAKDGRCLQLEVSMHVVSRRGRPVEVEGIAVPSTSPSLTSAKSPRCLDENFCNAI
jgi:PAS domain S-box-containing protein